MILEPEQLVKLTGFTRSDAQRRELEHMRVPYRARRDGSLVVLLAALAPDQQAIIPEPEPELMP